MLLNKMEDLVFSEPRPKEGRSQEEKDLMDRSTKRVKMVDLMYVNSEVDILWLQESLE